MDNKEQELKLQIIKNMITNLLGIVYSEKQNNDLVWDGSVDLSKRCAVESAEAIIRGAVNGLDATERLCRKNTILKKDGEEKV